MAFADDNARNSGVTPVTPEPAALEPPDHVCELVACRLVGDRGSSLRHQANLAGQPMARPGEPDRGSRAFGANGAGQAWPESGIRR